MHFPFFAEGKKYRVPGFLATSFQQDVALVFAERAFKDALAHGGGSAAQNHAVLWVVHVDPAGATNNLKLCRNASLVQKSHVDGEEEYLFVRCAVFTMDSAVLGLASSSCDCCAVRGFRYNFSPRGCHRFPRLLSLEALACM
jgi:hypothetical protein